MNRRHGQNTTSDHTKRRKKDEFQKSFLSYHNILNNKNTKHTFQKNKSEIILKTELQCIEVTNKNDLENNGVLNNTITSTLEDPSIVLNNDDEPDIYSNEKKEEKTVSKETIADNHKIIIDNINEINSNTTNCTNTKFTLIQEYDNNQNEVTHEKMDYLNIVNEPKNGPTNKNVLYKDKKRHEIKEQDSRFFCDLKAIYKKDLKDLRRQCNKELINNASKKKIANKKILQNKTVTIKEKTKQKSNSIKPKSKIGRKKRKLRNNLIKDQKKIRNNLLKQIVNKKGQY